MTDMEDRCRRNNVRLVGLPEGMEGPDAAVFLRANLSKWIPSLRGRDIEIDRAHRVYDGGRGSDRPRTLIFRVLRWHDRSDILKVLGRRIRWSAHRTMSHCCFFLTLVRLQRSGERHLVRFWRRWQHLVSSPSSSIQRWLSYGTKENKRSFDSPQKAEDFISSMSQQKSYVAALRGDDGGAAAAVFPVRREGRDGRDGLGPSCPEGDDSRMAMDAC